MSLFRRFAAFAFIVFSAAFIAGPVAAQSIEWRFKSEHPNVVDIELYADDRDHVWPGDGEVYTLRDYWTRTVEISCRRGEKVCYGGWVRNTRSRVWGAGPDGKDDCESCCYVCDGGRTPILVLD